MEATNRRCLTATLHGDNTISFCELPIVVDDNDDGSIVVLDGDEETFLDELDCDGSDCVAEIYVVADDIEELKSDLERRLRMRFAHFNLCEPHIPLKEISFP